MRATQSRESQYKRSSDYRSEVVMTNIISSLICNSFKVFTFSLVTLTIFSLNSFGQNNSSPANTTFGTLASTTEKPEVSAQNRPRIAYASKGIQAHKEEEKVIPINQSADLKPNTVLVDSAALALQLEQTAFKLLNEKRKENGLPPVMWSEDMAKVARLHSENMAKLKFFSHVGKDGLMVNDRADALGFTKWKAIGENIAYNRGYDNPAEFACERWMQSPSHRENILNKRWKEAGLGVSITADGTYYFTQVFVVR